MKNWKRKRRKRRRRQRIKQRKLKLATATKRKSSAGKVSSRAQRLCHTANTLPDGSGSSSSSPLPSTSTCTRSHIQDYSCSPSCAKWYVFSIVVKHLCSMLWDIQWWWLDRMCLWPMDTWRLHWRAILPELYNLKHYYITRARKFELFFHALLLCHWSISYDVISKCNEFQVSGYDAKFKVMVDDWYMGYVCKVDIT